MQLMPFWWPISVELQRLWFSDQNYASTAFAISTLIERSRLTDAKLEASFGLKRTAMM